jgi:hypothetical protein
MGEYSGEIAASVGGGEVNGLGSSQAHHVRIGTPENRGGAKGTLGEDTGAGEESGLEQRGMLLEPNTWARGVGFGCEVSKKIFVRMCDGKRVRGVVDEPKPVSFSE